jgi:hypothetical protein
MTLRPAQLARRTPASHPQDSREGEPASERLRQKAGGILARLGDIQPTNISGVLGTS